MLMACLYATQVVIHSCTKFLGGHSDILAGSVSVCNRHLEDKVWQARKLVIHTCSLSATLFLYAIS
jgi:cystathionine beta-lyase/cystathionine gamma-synthase